MLLSILTLQGILLLGLIFMMMFVFKYISLVKKQMRMQVVQARKKYEDALNQYSKNPTDSILRMTCIETGNSYYLFQYPDPEMNERPEVTEHNIRARQELIAKDMEDCLNVGKLKEMAS